jgi:hypothetical protein
MSKTAAKKTSSILKQKKTLMYSGPSPTVWNRFGSDKQRKTRSWQLQRACRNLAIPLSEIGRKRIFAVQPKRAHEMPRKRLVGRYVLKLLEPSSRLLDGHAKQKRLLVMNGKRLLCGQRRWRNAKQLWRLVKLKKKFVGSVARLQLRQLLEGLVKQRKKLVDCGTRLYKGHGKRKKWNNFVWKETKYSVQSG